MAPKSNQATVERRREARAVEIVLKVLGRMLGTKHGIERIYNA